MNLKHFFILFLACFAIFSLYLLTDKPINGADSYAYLGTLHGTMKDFTWTDSEGFIFQFLPYNILVLKIVLFLLFFASILIISFWGELFNKEYGWMTGLFTMLTPVLIGFSTLLENDQFAIPLIFLFGYLVTKAHFEKESRTKSLILASIALLMAILLWKGSVLMAIIMLPIELLLLPPIIIIGIAFYKRFSEQILSQMHFFNAVAEQQPLAAFGYIWILWAGAFFLPKILILPAIISFVLLLIAVKYSFFIIPFLAIGFMQCYAKVNQRTRDFLVYLLVVFILVWALWIIWQFPSANDLKAVDYAIAVSKDGNIQNSWDLGWYIKAAGGQTRFVAGAVKDYNFHGTFLMHNDENIPCKIVKNFERLTVYNC